MDDFIPYGKQCVDDDDLAEVAKALRGDFLTCGPYVEKFEKALCKKVGSEHAVVCNNGTTALHLSMLALGIGPGDSVIVPTITFLATANAAKYCGAEIVFADVDPETGLLTPETLEQAYQATKGRVKAAVVVHLAGQIDHLKEIKEFCDAKNISLIEDACHAIGGTGVGACQFSEMATFSFHPVKTITMGEGGAVTTSNAVYAEKMRLFRSHGMKRGSHWKYEMRELGYNYRAPDINCALGYSQLKKLDRFVERRREIARQYDMFFSNLDWVKPVVKPGNNIAYHLYPVLIDFQKIGKIREEFMDELKQKGIGTQVHYIPVHTQPYYGGSFSSLPGAARFYERVLSLPMFYSLSEESLQKVMQVLNDYSR